MIGLVQYTTGRKAADVEFELFAVDIECTRDDPHLAADDLIQPRERQASLVADLFALDVYYLRIDQHRTHLVVVIALGRIHHKEPPRDRDLRRREPDPAGIGHRLEHILYKHAQLIITAVFPDGSSDLQQDGLGVMDYRQQRHKSELYNTKLETRDLAGFRPNDS